MVGLLHPVGAGPWRPWLVLGAFFFHSMTNAFMWMDFASVSKATKSTLDVGGSDFNWLYSGGIVAACVAMPWAMALADKHHFAVLGLGVLFNCGGAWLRWLSVHQESFKVAMASSVLIGMDCGIIYTYFAPLADRWFTEERRSLVTSVAVQSNYLGWCLGAIIVPTVIDSGGSSASGDVAEPPTTVAGDLENFQFIQAFIVSASLPIFLLCHRDRPDYPDEPLPSVTRQSTRRSVVPSDDERGPFGGQRRTLSLPQSCLSVASRASRASRDPRIEVEHPVRQLLHVLRNRDYVLQAVCVGLLQGAGIAVPGVQDEIFTDQGFSSSKSRWTSALFIFSGVSLGLVFGSVCQAHRKRHPPLIKACFLLAALSLAGLCALAQWGDDLSQNTKFGLNLLLMALAGAGSISFIGLALPLCCAIVHPVSEAVSGGFVEFLGQAFAATLAQATQGFWVVAGAAIAAAVVYIIGYRYPEEDDEECAGLVEDPQMVS